MWLRVLLVALWPSVALAAQVGGPGSFRTKIGGVDFVCQPIKGGREKRCCLLNSPHRSLDKRCVDILHVPVPVPVPVAQARSPRPQPLSTGPSASAIIATEYARGRIRLPHIPPLPARGRGQRGPASRSPKVAAPKQSHLAAREGSFAGLRQPAPPPSSAYRNPQHAAYNRNGNAAYHPSQPQSRQPYLPRSVLDVFGAGGSPRAPRPHPAGTFSQRPLPPHLTPSQERVGFVPPLDQGFGPPPLDQGFGAGEGGGFGPFQDPLGSLEDFELGEGGVFTDVRPLGPGQYPPRSYPDQASKFTPRLPRPYGSAKQFIQPSPQGHQFFSGEGGPQTQPLVDPLALGDQRAPFRLVNPSPGALQSLNRGPQPSRFAPDTPQHGGPLFRPTPGPRLPSPGGGFPGPQAGPSSFRPNPAQLAGLNFPGQAGTLPARLGGGPQTAQPGSPHGSQSIQGPVDPRQGPVATGGQRSFRPNPAQLARLQSGQQPLDFQGRPVPTYPPRLGAGSAQPTAPPRPDFRQEQSRPRLEQGPDSLEDKFDERGSPNVFHRLRTAESAVKSRGRGGPVTVAPVESGAEEREGEFEPWPPKDATLLPGRVPCRRPWGCRPDRIVTSAPQSSEERPQTAAPTSDSTDAALNQPAERPFTRRTTRTPRPGLPTPPRWPLPGRPQPQSGRPRPQPRTRRPKPRTSRPKPRTIRPKQRTRRPRPSTRRPPPQPKERKTQVLTGRSSPPSSSSSLASANQSRKLPMIDISFPQAPPGTRCFVDVALVIDASGSVSDVWTEQLRLAADVVEGLELGDNAAKVALLKYAGPRKARLLHGFSDPQHKAAIVDQILNLNITRGITETSEALRLAAQQFSPEKGSRIGSSKPLAVVLTDGFSASSPMAAAAALLDKGVAVFAVAVTDGPRDDFDLGHIAGHPDRVFHRHSFDAFRQAFRRLTADCRAPLSRV